MESPTRIDGFGSGFPAPVGIPVIEPPTRIDSSGAEPATRIDAFGRQLTQYDGSRADDLAREDRRRDSGARLRYEPRRAAAGEPVVGPTAALRGRAGGPGFDVADGAGTVSPNGSAQSGWQQSHGVWESSGISWDQPATTLIDGQWTGLAGEAVPASETAYATPYLSAPVAMDYAPPAPMTAPPRTPPALTPPPEAGFFMPGPPMAEPGMMPQGTEPGMMPPGTATPGLTPPASVPPGTETGAGRRRTSRLVSVGLPAAVIVMVGAGAVMMLTGTSSELLGGQGTSPAPRAHGTSTGQAGGTAAGGTQPGGTQPGGTQAGNATIIDGQRFAGYPGLSGPVSVSSMATAGSTRLAVGSADGHPAIWQRSASGSWTLLSASQPAVYNVPGTEGLTSVAHGPAGWIAVGGATSGTSKGPVVLTSADGAAWHAISGTGEFAGTGLHTAGVAASAHGYVVVGQQVTGSRKFAAIWWSPDLKHWTRTPDGGLDGRLAPSGLLGVAANTGGGFIAIGTHKNAPAIWVSGTGRTWGQGTFSLPGDATSGSLDLIAVSGRRIVTAGNAVTATGASIPVVITSTDGNKTWQQTTLAKSGIPASVTSLTATGPGFTANGKSGGAAVTWTSPDGLTWTQTMVPG